MKKNLTAKINLKIFISLIFALGLTITSANAENTNVLAAPGNLWIVCKAALDIERKRMNYQESGKFYSITPIEAENRGGCIGYILGVTDNNFLVSPAVPVNYLFKKYVEYIDAHPELQVYTISKETGFATAGEILIKIAKNSPGALCMSKAGFKPCKKTKM